MSTDIVEIEIPDEDRFVLHSREEDTVDLVRLAIARHVESAEYRSRLTNATVR